MEKNRQFDKSSLTLPKGKSILLFKVETENDLPAIKVSFNGKVSTDNWKASMDGTEWNIAETSPVFGKLQNAFWMIRKQRLPFIRFPSYLYGTQLRIRKVKDSEEWIYSG